MLPFHVPRSFQTCNMPVFKPTIFKDLSGTNQNLLRPFMEQDSFINTTVRWSYN